MKLAVSWWLVAVALIAACAASLLVGSRPIPAAEVWSALSQHTGTSNEIVILHSRIPRTAAGLLVGLAFGVAGALIQSFTRNPLADPGILGVNAGAACAIALGVAFFHATHPAEYVWFALIGAIAATTAVYAIGSAGGRQTDPLTLTLAGVALAAILTGVTTAVTLLNPEAFNEMRYWGAGSLTNRGFDVLAIAVPFVICGFVLALMISRHLDTIALGDDTAASLGTKVTASRNAAIVAVTLLCGAATAVSGPIGFVGLMVPHVVRWVVGPNNALILAFTALVAPCLVLCSDVIGRVITSGEVQVGVVTAFVGAPILIYLARKPQAAGL